MSREDLKRWASDIAFGILMAMPLGLLIIFGG